MTGSPGSCAAHERRGSHEERLAVRRGGARAGGRRVRQGRRRGERRQRRGRDGGQDRPGRDRGHDHARLPAGPQRRLRAQRQVDDGGREPLLGRQEQGGRDLRAPDRGQGPGHRL